MLTNDFRLLRDAKLFNSRIGHIDGAGNIGTYLLQLVEQKMPPQPTPKPDEKKPEEAAPAPEPEKTEETKS
jgi:vacuolar protein sorting-associated protein 54